MEKQDKNKKNLIAKIMEIGKVMAKKSKNDKINKAIKEKANY